MRKAHEAAVLVVLTAVALVGSASAQSSSSPSNASQMSSANLSPDAQAKLEQKVSRALIKLPRYGVFDNIAYRLEGRTVILEGQVHVADLKPEAEKAVMKVEGVEKVVNNLEVLPPNPGDDRVRRAVQAAIYSYPPLSRYNQGPNSPIHIIVSNGRVTLDGVVDSEADKNAVTVRVNQVQGIVSSTNNLRVVK